jgi:hypothetical protein
LALPAQVLGLYLAIKTHGFSICHWPAVLARATEKESVVSATSRA